jgi:hypothetical protein
MGGHQRAYSEEEHKTIVDFIKENQLSDLFDFSDKPNGSRVIEKRPSLNDPDSPIFFTVNVFDRMFADRLAEVFNVIVKDNQPHEKRD